MATATKKMVAQMNDSEAMEAVKRGQAVMLCEYRGFSGDVMTWNDKTTGRRKTAPIAVHRLETETESLSITEFLEEDADVDEMEAPFKKGEKCWLLVEALKNEKGTLTARGQLVGLRPSPAAKP